MKNKKKLGLSIVALLTVVIICTSALSNARADVSDISDDVITLIDAVEIIEEAGFQVPDNAQHNRRVDRTGRDLWFISWGQQDAVYTVEIDAVTGEIVCIVAPPQSEERLINNADEAISIALQRLNDIKNVDIPDILYDLSPEITEPIWIIRGWRIKWYQQVSGIPAGGHIIAEISTSGEIVCYVKIWLDIDETTITTRDVIGNENAIKSAERWIASDAPSLVYLRAQTTEKTTSELYIGIPYHDPEETERSFVPVLMYNVNFILMEYFVTVQIDAGTGEYLGMTTTRSWPVDIHEHAHYDDPGSNNRAVEIAGLIVIGLVIGITCSIIVMKKKHQ